MKMGEKMYLLRVMSLVLAALALVPAGSHLFSLTSKMRLDANAYFVAQRAYDGWSLFGIVVVAALLTTLALTMALFRADESYLFPLLAFLCIAATQLVFWVYTFPANRSTRNWTEIPPDWEALRVTWEYSHAASAILNFLALFFLIVAAVRET